MIMDWAKKIVDYIMPVEPDVEEEETVETKKQEQKNVASKVRQVA